jgi:hypothetical protein
MSRKDETIKKLCNILPANCVKHYHYVENKFPHFSTSQTFIQPRQDSIPAA